MERKRYLELCQKYAVGQPVKVKYKGVVYHPLRYGLAFDENGKITHTAILKDTTANSISYCDLEGVESYEEQTC